jgi:hypothetical protein
MNGSHVGTGRSAAAWSRLVRSASLLLAISLVPGCSSPERDDADTQSVPAAKASGEQGAGGPANARWPNADLATFVFTHLDLTTFRNSTGSQRNPGDRFFSDLGIRPTQASDSVTTHEGEWRYSVRVLARRDFNGDGLDDVAICFADQARNGGTYDARSPLLLQLVDRRAIALGFEIDGMDEAETCQRVP